MVTRTIRLLMACAAVSSFAPAALRAEVGSQASWDSHFEGRCSGGAQDVECILGYSNGYDDTQARLAWHGHYWIRAYVAMARQYGELKYLDYAVWMIDFMLDQRDDARAARGELKISREPYSKAPLYYLNNRDQVAPCWRRVERIKKRFISADCKTVEDGQITSAIMHFVSLVKFDSRFTEFDALANAYLIKVAETINIWDETYVLNRFADVPGSYYWPAADGSRLYTSAVPFNQSAALLIAAMRVDETLGAAAHHAKVTGLIDYWRLHLRPQPNGSCIWDYDPQSPESQGVEDFNHGHIDVGFLLTAYELGFSVSTSEMTCVALAYTQNVYRGGGNLHDQIDGTTDGSSTDPHGAAAVDWIDYFLFDPAALDIAIEVYQSHFPAPTWAKPFMGWAKILHLTDAPAEDPGPPPGNGDTVPPNVTIATPQDGATIAARSQVAIAVDATDDVQMTRVEIFINNDQKATIMGPGPYDYVWKVPGRKGRDYSITAFAFDSSENEARHTINVSVPR